MASITFDGQTLTLDSKRLWLVSGQICYARVPRSVWAERIHAAKLAGLNCIETPVIWARHEPRAGQFDFKDGNDIRHFVELIGQAGMHCILRPGPFIDAGWDNGGLPAWLPLVNNIKLRTANQPFLEACSRYITAVAQQVRDLQAVAPTTTGRGAASAAANAGKAPGPIVLVQNEHAWLCGHDDLARTYLGELSRYFREAGFAVPIINANEMWQSLEGEIECWSGYSAMLSHLRQLAHVRPEQPRIVIDFKLGRVHRIGRAAEPSRTEGEVVRALGEVLAGGGQYNLSPFHGGTNYGFSSGRDPRSSDAYFVTSNDRGAPLSESGQPGTNYHGVRRISTFASRFSRLLTNLEPTRQTVSLVPPTDAPGAAGNGKAKRAKSPGASGHHGESDGVSVVHATGSQGSIAWVFADDSAAAQGRNVTLLLPDGLTLPVEVRGQPVVWCVLDARLSGRAVLDYTNLCALATAGKTLVLFGPAGSQAVLSINGAPLEAPVPEGDEPGVHQHEGVTVVIASSEQVERIFVDDSPMNPGGSVYLNVSTLDRHGRPVPHHACRQYTRIDSEGVATVVKVGTGKGAVSAPPPPPKPGKIALDEWTLASCHEYTAGSSARYATIGKTDDLTALGSPYGYGWYRAKFASSSPHRVHAVMPRSGHRLHLWLDEQSAGLVGVGPGAAEDAHLQLKKGQRTLVALVENLGRVSAGPDLGEHVGLTGDAWAVEPLKVGKPKLVAADPVDLLAYRAPLWRVHREDVSDPRRLTWSFEHRRKTPLFIRIAPFDIPADAASPDSAMSGLVLLNGKPIHFFQGGGQTPIVLDPATLARGKNELQITMLSSTADVADALTKAVTFVEGVDCITDEAEWAFAKWERPAVELFEKPKASRRQGEPAWWRCTFEPGDDTRPVWFDATGLSKGQLYVNTHHVGRYFVATGAGKHVPPQIRYHVPRSMLISGQTNELYVFDEHGFSPGKTRLIVDPSLSPFE